MNDPQWLIAILVIIGQVGTGVAIVYSIKGDVREVRQTANQAKTTANKAHNRIDLIMNRRESHGTSQA